MPEINILDLIISLLITIAVYSLPIIIYRYAILKHTIEKKKAKRITIIYAICGLVIMNIIAEEISGEGAGSGGLLLWSFVNYKMLVGRNNKKEKAESSSHN